MGKSRGQLNVEFLSIMGITLLVILVFLALSGDFLAGLGADRNTSEAQDSVDRLARAADFVYAQGEGASKRVDITIPDDANFGPESTYIGKPPSADAGALPRTININVYDSNVFATTKADLTGNFPATSGGYPMRVISRGNYVSITPYLADVDKYSIFISMPNGSARSTAISISKVPSEDVTAVVSYTWGFSDVSIAVSPSSLSVPAGGSPVLLTFTANAAARGTYNSQITVTSTGATSGASETVKIPVTIDVRG